MADTSTQGDTVMNRGTTGAGSEGAYTAKPWDRGLSVLENEPVTSLAASGLEDSPPWTQYNSQPSPNISAVPGPVSQVGRWPIPGSSIHGRLAGMQNEKDLGTGAERGRIPGEVSNGGSYY